MTDGPFKNTKLPSRWKQYGKDLVNDAVSLEERVARVCHNMLADVDSEPFRRLWKSLEAYVQAPQLDLDSEPAIEAIFDAHKNSPHTSILQKHVIANLRDDIPVQQALNGGLSSAAEEWREIDKNRFDDHCLSARDQGDMTNSDFRKGIRHNRETFNAIDLSAVCDALRMGNKSAFKPALQKKKGIDEGPDE